MAKTHNKPEVRPQSPGDASDQTFREALYRRLDIKLRDTPWNSGASEAHGLLCALAGRGIQPQDIRQKAGLFQLTEVEHIDLIEGLYALVCRELDDEEFGFQLLLPDDNQPIHARIEAVTDWCQGFLQGIYHDQGRLPEQATPIVQEAAESIMEIGHLATGTDDSDLSEHHLMEVIEFLRVAAQLIHDSFRFAPSPAVHSRQLN